MSGYLDPVRGVLQGYRLANEPTGSSEKSANPLSAALPEENSTQARVNQLVVEGEALPQDAKPEVQDARIDNLVINSTALLDTVEGLHTATNNLAKSITMAVTRIDAERAYSSDLQEATALAEHIEAQSPVLATSFENFRGNLITLIRHLEQTNPAQKAERAQKQ